MTQTFRAIATFPLRSPLPQAASILLALGLLGSCGGGEGGGLFGEGESFIRWADSANGTEVADANNVYVRFLASSRVLQTGGYNYPSYTVDSGSPTLRFNGQMIGAITLVKGSSGAGIAGLVGNDGRFLAVSGSGTNFSLKNSSLRPVYASAIGSGSSGGGNCAADANVKKYTDMCSNANSITACYCASAYLNKCLGNAAQANQDYNGMLAFTANPANPTCPRP